MLGMALAQSIASTVLYTVANLCWRPGGGMRQVHNAEELSNMRHEAVTRMNINRAK